MVTKRLNEITQRKKELLAELPGAGEERMAQIQAETDALIQEETELRARLDLEGKLGEREDKPDARTRRDQAEQRGRDLKEKRAVTIGSGQLIKPTGHQTSINGEIGGSVSSIIDLVKVTPCYGMSEYQVPYESGGMTASKTAEGAAVSSSDAAFAYVSIKPVTIATYSEITAEAMKLTDVDYYSAVLASARKALRKKVAEYIVNSDAASNPIFIGIKDASAIEAATDVSLSKIDEKTLRTIVMSYGGDEDVVGGGVLLLTKADLVAFGDVRGTSEKKYVYEITPDASNPNTGVIKDGGLSVRYCLNSNLTGLAAAATGKYAMVYGVPSCYEVGLFSDYTVRVSEDYAFQKRMLAILGEVSIGGNVTVKNGFVRVKKAGA